MPPSCPQPVPSPSRGLGARHSSRGRGHPPQRRGRHAFSPRGEAAEGDRVCGAHRPADTPHSRTGHWPHPPPRGQALCFSGFVAQAQHGAGCSVAPLSPRWASLGGEEGIWACPSRPGALGQSGGPDNKPLLLPVRASTTGAEQELQEVTLSAPPAVNEAGNKSVKTPQVQEGKREGASPPWEREGCRGEQGPPHCANQHIRGTASA